MRHTIQHSLDPSQEIWRYMSIDKFSLLMSRRRLWFTRGDLLGDEHEGSLPDSIIDERQQRLHDHRVLKMIENGGKESRKHAFVSCWSMQAPNILLMWKIYTPDATGVAIKTTVDQLVSCFVSRPNDLFDNLNPRVEKITYIPFDSYNAAPDAFDPFTHKQEAYRYEREIRMILSFIPTVEEPPIGIEKEVDLDFLINEIYVSNRIGDDLERFIENLMIENQIKKPMIHPPFVRTPRH